MNREAGAASYVKRALRQQPGVCPESIRRCCRTHEAEDLKGDIFGRRFIVCPICRDKRCAHADDCANDCTGQQPAQPGSGEVKRFDIYLCDGDSGRCCADMQAHPCGDYVLAADFDRLQSALTEAQRENAALRNLAANLQPGPISEALSGQRYTTETELRDQLTSAQQRIADLHAALRTYGWHKPECDYMQEELPCTCGFLTAVERDFPENSNG